MLVEDEGLVRLVIAEGLADAGFVVVEAVNGDEAIRLLDGPAELDLLLTDVQMPGRTDGNLVADAAKRRHPHLPVIYMTGNPSSLRNTVGKTDALLRKPFGPSEVVLVIRRLLARSHTKPPAE
jgi:CheY-like chemotaxis protein